MDGLFSLIWVVFIVVTLTNALTGKNKKKQKKREQGVPPFTAGPITQPLEKRSFQDWMNDVAAAQTAQPVAPKQPKPQQTRMELEPVLPSQPAPAAPRVHTHLSLDCDQDDPSGSMDFISTEGRDPCHDEELPNRGIPRPSFPAAQEQPGLALEWDSNALVRSVIMQEVLTRPCQRKRR